MIAREVFNLNKVLQMKFQFLNYKSKNGFKTTKKHYLLNIIQYLCNKIAHNNKLIMQKMKQFIKSITNNNAI
jgi:hypothetical protein